MGPFGYHGSVYFLKSEQLDLRLAVMNVDFHGDIQRFVSESETLTHGKET